MTEGQELPLVTFALIAYNQEKYICEAVKGALEQDYQPLEIIFSDDCSTDRTFKLIHEMVGSYVGPHRIFLNRNEKNLGIGAHVDKVLNMSNGEWIVMAAGDDISLPSRVSKTMIRAQDNSRPVDCISVELEEIDTSGKKTGRIRNKIVARHLIGASTLAGAGLAYSRRVVEKFNPISEDIQNEDVVLTARALLLSDVGFVSEPLVLYRSHERNRPKTNRHIDDFGINWITSKQFFVKKTKAMAAQVRADAADYNPKRIPYFDELIKKDQEARISSQLLYSCKPNTFQNFVLIAKNKTLLKLWIGIIISKLNSINKKIDK